MIKMKIMLSSIFLMLFITVNAQDNPQVNQQSGNNTKYETHYKQTADDLAQNLKARINLDDSQVSKVSDVIAEYNRRVWGIKYHLTPGSPNVTLNPNNNSDTKDQAAARGQNDSPNYYAGLGRMEMENLRDADRTADQDIVNVLNSDQKQKYVDVKLDWWSVVKDRIYNASYKDNMKNDTKQNEDMNQNPDIANPNKENWK